MTNADSTWYFAGKLEGYRLERFGERVVGTRPDGSTWWESTELTKEMARISFHQIHEDAYKVADGGGHL